MSSASPKDASGSPKADRRIQLFHAISDEGSAAARRLIVERGIGVHVRLRNVYYPEVEADLRAHGGGSTPALWDGARLIEGAAAVLARLAEIRF